MLRARDPIMEASFTLAPGVHRPRRPQPYLDRTRLSTHPKQARYSTDYAPLCGTNIMRGTLVGSKVLMYRSPPLNPPLCQQTYCTGVEIGCQATGTYGAC